MSIFNSYQIGKKHKERGKGRKHNTLIRSRIFFDFFILLYLLLFSFRFPVENPFFNNCGFFFPNKKMSQVVVDNLCVVSGFHRKTKISNHRCACIIASDMNVADSFLPPNHRPLRPSTAAFAVSTLSNCTYISPCVRYQ